jgi:very-short-patch-repair endonuclease
VGGIDDPDRPLRWRETRDVLDDRGAMQVIRFGDQPSRERVRAEWIARWNKWANDDRPARKARAAYDELFSLRGRLDREGESLELLVGNGRLRARTQDGALDYPVLLQRIELEFDPDVPEFRVRDADRDAELNASLLQRIPDVQAALLVQLREELEENDFHPLGEKDAVAWLRSLIHRLTPGGELMEEPGESSTSSSATLANAPLLLLRRRSMGVPEAMERAVRALELGVEVPRSIWRVVGVESAPTQDNSTSELGSNWDGALLSKPANEEQIDLIRQVESTGSVLVQGPPGTGKSHTIANLIGHLVASGQRVLVTSHTTKALRVLREHVVPVLRPLCVSILDDDARGREQLEEAIRHIQSGIQRPSDQTLARQERELAAKREHLAKDIASLRRDLLTIRQTECTTILYDNEQVLPIDAAKWVHKEASRHSWIDGSVQSGVPLPLSEAELRELYGTNRLLSKAEEEQLLSGLPDVGQLLSGELLAEALAGSKHDISPLANSCFREPSVPGDGEPCASLAHKVREQLHRVDSLRTWEREVVASSVSGDARLTEWNELAEFIERAAHTYRSHRAMLIDSEPMLPNGWRLDDAQATVAELCLACRPGASIGRIGMLLHPRWRRFVDSALVRGNPPKRHEDFKALEASVEVEVLRDSLAKRWRAQVEPIGGEKLDHLGSNPEEAAEPFAADLRASLQWWATSIAPLIGESEQLGLQWQRLLAGINRGTGRFGEFDRLVAALRTTAEALEARAKAQRVLACRKLVSDQREYLKRFPVQIAIELLAAIDRENPATWNSARMTLGQLIAKRAALARRKELLETLESCAPSWARTIRDRVGIHAASEPPGDPALAWRWSQFSQELRRRSVLDERDLAKKLALAESQHQEATSDLIDRRTWLSLRRRTGLAQQQALVGWADLIRKAGKRTGKRAPMLLAQARKQLDLARDAVPVWIMPLARVFESINPESTRFDVVVLDEASQADVTALFAVLLGARAVVVGDHEQVSPDAIGQKQQDVDRLIDQHLDSIPNAKLYIGGTSIYDLARQSFPGQLRLVEHFRCVREIIEFSNRLSYNNEIRPLRESASALAPHLVEHIVLGSRGDEKINGEEAEAVACLVGAAIEQPEYNGRSMGVVSLLGVEQAVLIDGYLRRHLSPREFLERKLICGNAAQFQGDERDVMFLTMVDSSATGPLSMRSTDMYRQRYNVAASRARDQMWLVHSLDPQRDLKAGDLRLRLIQHVRNPDLLSSEAERAQSRVESPFEAEVVSRLVNAGYRLSTQVPVGAFRIDIVVYGADRRVALECDGEQFHPPSALEADFARQRVLERLGWKFIRLRGSRYYLDPNAAIKWLKEQLVEHRVEPLGPLLTSTRIQHRGKELLERVRRRATELQLRWFPKKNQDDR